DEPRGTTPAQVGRARRTGRSLATHNLPSCPIRKGETAGSACASVWRRAVAPGRAVAKKTPPGRSAMDAALEKSTMRKVYLRLLPFAVLSYILAYIDRINVSFAALTMPDDLHMSAGDFGFAAGTFYCAY